jgi:hypothetical protein
LYLKAMETSPGVFQIAVECITELLRAGRAEEVAALVAELPTDVAGRGRLRFLRVQAALATGDWRLAVKMLKGTELADIREGDNSITELWFSAQEKRLAELEGAEVDDDLRQRVRRECPSPRNLDFRMFRQGK